MRVASSDPLPVIAGLLDAVHAGDDWSHALDRVARLFGGNNASMMIVPANGTGKLLAAASNCSTEDQARYLARHEEDPRNVAGFIQARRHGYVMVRDGEFEGAGDYMHTDVYREVLRPNELDHSLSIGDARHPDHLLSFAVNASRLQGGFEDWTLGTLRAFVPFTPLLVRLVAARAPRVALPLHWIVRESRRGLEDLSGGLADFIAAVPALTVRHGRLQHCHPRANRLLRRSIDAALTGWQSALVDDPPVAPEQLALPGARISVRALRRHDADGNVVSDAEIYVRPTHLPKARTGFDRLTPAEYRLLQALARGESIARHAESMSISKHTVRSHLKRIFEKTGSHSQHELVVRYLRNRPGSTD